MISDLRGMRGESGMSFSVARRPGAARAVPEVTMKGLARPAGP